ncbi:MAG: hypothetical protein ABIF71_03590 [Planctomycetota bacterium]
MDRSHQQMEPNAGAAGHGRGAAGRHKSALRLIAGIAVIVRHPP